MGYRVEYGPVKKVRGVEKRTSHRAALTGGVLLLFLLISSWLWPEGIALLRQWMIPGDPAVTTAAFDSLCEDLQSGEQIVRSLRVFCQQILNGAGFGTGQ